MGGSDEIFPERKTASQKWLDPWELINDLTQAEEVASADAEGVMNNFMEGNYAKCIEMIAASLPKLQKPSKEHDLYLHVHGGSHY